MQPKDVKKKVMILTGNYRIQGEITIPDNVRLTDHIAQSRHFFALTHAKVFDHHGQETLAADFLDVHRDRVEILVPEDGED